jgi:hypothetical protein
MATARPLWRLATIAADNRTALKTYARFEAAPPAIRRRHVAFFVDFLARAELGN